jgi:ribose 5-phosphate isomerase B
MMASPGTWRIGIGADDVGSALKSELLPMIDSHPRVRLVRDFSLAADELARPYPVVAIRTGEAIVRGDIDRAILICGTGIGMCIAATKVPGIRAAVVHDTYSAERSVLSNNCQIMTLGARIVALVYAYRLVSEWLGYEFDITSSSGAKLRVIAEYEEQLGRSRDFSQSPRADVTDLELSPSTPDLEGDVT